MSFRITSVTFDKNKIDLSEQEDFDERSNQVTVIVGKNGIGKSRLLSSITRTFEATERNGVLAKDRSLFSGPQHNTVNDFKITFKLNNRTQQLTVKNGRIQNHDDQAHPSELHNCTPRKVIATSTSPYDKFPVTRSFNQIGQTTNQTYKYLGTKDRLGSNSSLALLDRVVDSLLRASDTSEAELTKLGNVFRFLGYTPKIIATYSFEISPNRFLEALHQGGISTLSHLTRHPRTHRAYRQLENNPQLLDQVFNIFKELQEKSLKNREILFDVDFSDGSFKTGDLITFEHTALLRRLGLMRLSDIQLTSSSGASYSIREASSGEQCIIATILGIASEIEDHSLICIDEPEISLHPEWQEKFVGLLSKTFSNYSGCHFLIATHSPQIISRIGSENCSILVLDSHPPQLLPAKDFYRKSADYQLANALNAPGYSNEYLARECLNIISRLGSGVATDHSTLKVIEKLRELRPRLAQDDPVAGLMDAIFAAMGQ